MKIKAYVSMSSVSGTVEDVYDLEEDFQITPEKWACMSEDERNEFLAGIAQDMLIENTDCGAWIVEEGEE